jgi:uncharacterized protein (DUF302 family)
MSSTGIIDLAFSHSAVETADRLESLLKAKGIKLFSRIDQTAEAKAVGLSLRPTVLLIFGNSKAGTPLMNRYPSFAIDLPLKALIWESADGKVWLSYNSPEYLQHRHDLDAPPFGTVANLLSAATKD